MLDTMFSALYNFRKSLKYYEKYVNYVHFTDERTEALNG